MFRSNRILLLAALILTFLGSTAVFAQKRTREILAAPVPEASAATPEQCRNGAAASPSGCFVVGGNSGWVGGNAGQSNAHWAETQFVSYRMLLTGLPGDGTTVHTLVIGFDVFENDRHATDYLGTFDFTESNSDGIATTGSNPCVGVAGAHCSGASGYPEASGPPSPSDTEPTPTEVEPGLVNPNGQIPGVFSIWGGNFVNGSIKYLPYDGGVERRVELQFTSTVSNPVIAWGGHLAWQGDWGLGNSAGFFNGSNYHMRLISLNGSGGNQDLPLSASAVIVPAKLTIIKDAVPAPGGDASGVGFTFNSEYGFNPLSFVLFDNGTAADRKTSEPISLFGPANAVTVSEVLPNTWGLNSVQCVGNDTPVVVDLNNALADITLNEAEIVTCTFQNVQTIASAAPASVSGRVTDAYGRGISSARITVFNASSGAAKTVLTNTFGYYRVSDLTTGDFYLMNVSHKRYTFVNDSRSFSLSENISGMDFQASK